MTLRMGWTAPLATRARSMPESTHAIPRGVPNGAVEGGPKRPREGNGRRVHQAQATEKT